MNEDGVARCYCGAQLDHTCVCGGSPDYALAAFAKVVEDNSIDLKEYLAWAKKVIVRGSVPPLLIGEQPKPVPPVKRGPFDIVMRKRP